MKISKDLIKNDVPASGQLKDNDCVSFTLTDGADIKILFLGNSITRHGAAENLGWFGDWGMAASCKENDYVHRVVKMLEAKGLRVSYCIANLSEWERTLDKSLLKNRYAVAHGFTADIAVVRLGENAGLAENLNVFIPCYCEMVNYFAESGARIILTDLFWQYEPFDGFVQKFAKEKSYGFVQIHDLGDCDEMKALKQFDHKGVAAHPGDKGMEEIANRIYKEIERIFDFRGD
ncbi:MAG: SGNH/GDSL hydrolase family protein [Clostridia bacterium]|nr:SGNH/GDSL hydrolase family protein [Clostridia bacterium]